MSKYNDSDGAPEPPILGLGWRLFLLLHGVWGRAALLLPACCAGVLKGDTRTEPLPPRVHPGPGPRLLSPVPPKFRSSTSLLIQELLPLQKILLIYVHQCCFTLFTTKNPKKRKWVNSIYQVFGAVIAATKTCILFLVLTVYLKGKV